MFAICAWIACACWSAALTASDASDVACTLLAVAAATVSFCALVCAVGWLSVDWLPLPVCTTMVCGWDACVVAPVVGVDVADDVWLVVELLHTEAVGVPCVMADATCCP